MKDLLQKTHLRALMLVVLLCAGFNSAWGAEGDVHDMSISFSKLLNNNASIDPVSIEEQAYSVKAVTINWRYNKSTADVVTIEVKVGGSSWGAKSVGTNTTADVIFEGIPSKGPIEISFTNNAGSGTGKGTFYVNSVKLTEGVGSTALSTSDLALTGAPIALNFDLYNNSSAQTVNYTTSSTGAVTVSESEYITTSVSGKTITVTPVKVTPYAQTITVSQTADDTYAAGSTTFTVAIDDSTPFNGEVFIAGTDKGTSVANNSDDKMTKGVVRIYGSDAAFATEQYRMYKNSTTTISTTDGSLITKIEFTGISNYAASNFSKQTGWATSGTNGVWVGEAESVSFIASSGQVRATQILVTVAENPNPSIISDNLDIAYEVKSGTIDYIVENPVDEGTLSATTTADWLSIGTIGTTIPFTCTANEAATSRSATVTLIYTYGDKTVYKEITITQAANPNGPGTVNNPYSVANVLALYENDIVPSNQVYVKGIISEISSLNTSQYKSARYYISDSGTKDNQFYVYNGKYLDGANFTTDDQIQVGDEIIVYGKLTSYEGINEFDQGNYIVSLNRPEPVELAAPIIFHDGGEYEGALKVAMAGQGTIKYTLNGGAEQPYSAPINVSETTTITAWTESNGVKSDEVSKTFTIAAATAGPAVEDNYYTIKNNGNNKYVNVAGRKTVTFVGETATAAGTVIRVKADDKGQVQILRSQGVDIPGYAEKAMNYVPKIVELIVDKLHAEGSGELLGENGLDAIMAKFKESFDYHLYLEEANGGYRIYGRTPSMQPVVDFYAENKANVDAKLPGLEAFINSAIEKVLQKTNGSGASILVHFSLQTVWEKMGSTLTEPVDEASTAKFYEEVLSSEANVWNFAYETAMIYWTKLKEHRKFQDNLDKLGDYAKYIDKVENIRPNFKYYIVQKDNQLDFISQGNSELNAAFTTWTLAKRTDFSVAFNEDNLLNGKYYTTLYTDFAYTLPEGVKAYKVTKVSDTGVAVKEELTTVPAQTPVLLEATSADTQTLTLSTEDGTAPTDNLLKGADFLINEYTIKTAQIESLFDLAKEMLGESAYETYMKEYEHLMLRNSGTVNNKYFFGLDQTDLKSVENVRMLNLNDAGEKLGFYSNWTELETNKAFIVDSNDPVKLFLRGDVNRDGIVDVLDVTATVDISLNRATPETHSKLYDFDAADADRSGVINVTDAVIIVNLSLGKE